MLKRKKEIMILVITIILFIIASYYSQRYAEELKTWVMHGKYLGAFIYIFLVIVAIVFAPFETLPLMPVAVAIWGPMTTALLTMFGWTAGALIAFFIARRYGQKLVCRIARIGKIENMGLELDNHKVFLLIILARIILPVDIVSYAFGLFTKIHWRLYLAATIIGVVPFALIYSYGAILPLAYQIIAGIIIFIILLASYPKLKKAITS